MKRRRTSHESSNEGLTDVVTNLVGALVLVVIVVIAITRPRIDGRETPPPREREVGENSPIDELLERIRGIGSDIDDVRGSMQQAEFRLDDAEHGISELLILSQERNGT